MTLRTARVTYSKRTPPIPAVRKREAIERESMTDQPADGTLTTEKKLRINWHSNAPWANTGYGNQTRLFVPRIKELGYPMSITAFYGLQGGKLQLGDVTVYPVGKHPYGQDVLGSHAIHSGANAIITLMDAWVVQPENTLGVPWFPWFPIDSEPMPSNVYAMVKQAKKPIVMSKYGKKQAEAMGLDVYYVPHGVDTKVFKPVDRAEARDRLGFPRDKFIVGMVAANKGTTPPRKAFHEQIAAFKAFHMMNPDTLLYIHTDDGTHGGDSLDLQKFCKVMGLKTGYVDCKPLPDDIDVALVDQYQNQLGIPDAYMVDIYNAFDVLLMCSMGEGFGIPLVEAQACGCPVITGEWTAMGELCFSGWKVSKAETTPYFIQFYDAFQFRVKEEAVVDRLLKSYEMRGNNEYRSRARDGALAYDADKVTEKYWKPVLADIEAHLSEVKSE